MVMEEEMNIWDGLACPPMDDYAFNFSDLDHGSNATGIVTSLDPDVFFEEPLKEKKTEKQIKNFPKKELKKLALFFEQDIDPVAYSRDLALEMEKLDKQKADKEGTLSNKTQPQPPIRNIELVTNKKTGVLSKNPQAPSMKQEKKLLDANVFFGKSSEEQRDCNKNMTKKPKLIIRIQGKGKGKELRKVFEVMRPRMEADAYEKVVKYAKAEMEKDHAKYAKADMEKDCPPIMEATKRKLHESYEGNDNSKKQKTKKVPEIQRLPPKSNRNQKPIKDRQVVVEKDHAKYAKSEMEKDHALKLEATKRKLRQSYEQINNCKRQRSIKLIEFQPPVPMSKPTIQKTKPKTEPTIVKTKPQTKPKSRTTWGSRLAKTVADICS